MERLQRNAVPILLGAGFLVAAVLTLVLTKDTTFAGDNWAFLMTRRDPSVHNLLYPHNEHLVVIPVLIDELLLRVFGMDSARPEQVLLVVFLLTTAALLYVYVKRRVGPWLALMATLLVLFLGPAWEVLLWPFEITFIGPVMFGLAMLLALEREDTKGDVAACAFLTLGLGFSNLGVAFIPAAAVAVLIGPRERWLRRSYVFLVPAVLFGIWYLGWGTEAESHVSLSNVLSSPQFVFESAAVSVGALSGLGTSAITNVTDSTWGKVLLVALTLGAVAWKLRHRGPLARWLWPVAAAALANWFLTAFNLFAGREAAASRYQYIGAIFVLLVLANVFKGARPSRNALIAFAVVTALAIGPNLVVLKNGSNVYEEQAALTRADTAAIEIAQRTVDPSFQLTPEIAGTPSLINIYASEYLQAVDEYGSPAYSQSELEAAPAVGRRAADIVLAHALPLSVSGVDSRTGSRSGCVVVPGGEATEVTLSTPVTRVEADPGEPAALALRRFSDPGVYPVNTEGVPGGAAVELDIPRDLSPRPWQLSVDAAQPVRVCPA
ncbi:MAG TPA: glycosyltransferase family 39 protein [Solirubrobacterales bacterium]|jgi:hypothetical protein|nr:glycosyltransferase family 39 protein [Solirubrobacterales bacterium]